MLVTALTPHDRLRQGGRDREEGAPRRHDAQGGGPRPRLPDRGGVRRGGRAREDGLARRPGRVPGGDGARRISHPIRPGPLIQAVRHPDPPAATRTARGRRSPRSRTARGSDPATSTPIEAKPARSSAAVRNRPSSSSVGRPGSVQGAGDVARHRSNGSSSPR